jgi:hypothetical protein
LIQTGPEWRKLFGTGFFFYFSSRHSRFYDMRPKVVIAVLLAGLAGLAGILFLKRLATPAQPAETSTARQEIKTAAPAISPTANTATAATPVVTVAQVITIPRVAADTNMLADEHQIYVQDHIDKLQELQAHDDAPSLQAILSELTNSDKEIRAAALEATIQFSSRDAIPVLKNLAARTDDPDEKKELLDAAEFLELPSLTEIQSQNPNVKIVSPQNQPAAPVHP